MGATWKGRLGRLGLLTYLSGSVAFVVQMMSIIGYGESPISDLFVFICWAFGGVMYLEFGGDQ
jgi:hypothetical protein